MASYYPSFNYLGINSRDKNLVVVNLEGGDQGEADSFLGMEPIYTDNASGTQRLDYGAKFNNVAVIKITVIKQDGSDFSVENTRDCLKWLTGSRKTSPLELTEHFEDVFNCDGNTSTFTLNEYGNQVYSVYVNGTRLEDTEWNYDVDNYTVTLSEAPENGASVKIIYNKIKFYFVGRVTNVWHYKMDARTVGISLEFTSISPWAYSPVQIIQQDITGTEDNPNSILIPNGSDDVDTPVYMKVTYTNNSPEDKGSLILTNTTNDNAYEVTKIENLVKNEIVTINTNQTIVSDNTTRIFGNDFSFVFPRLLYADNIFTAVGTGHIKFEYVVPIKVGDCIMDMSSKTDPICSESGQIQIDTLPWSRISEIPSTVRQHGITDVYTKDEVDIKIGNITVENVYTKAEINQMLENFVDDDVYTKQEVDALLSSAEVKIDEDTLSAMLAEVLN